MRKINIMACALSSALAVSLGSISVYAAPESEVSAPAIENNDGSDSDDVSSPESNEDATLEKTDPSEYVLGLTDASTGGDNRDNYDVLYHINSDIEYNQEDGIIQATFDAADFIHFKNFTWKMGERNLDTGSMDGSCKGDLSIMPKENGVYSLILDYETDYGKNGEVYNKSITMNISVSSSKLNDAAETSELKVAEKKVAETSSVSADNSKKNVKLDVSYFTTDGSLKATSDAKGQLKFTWYKDDKQVSEEMEFIPKDEGSYYCIMTDKDNPEDKLTSRTISLYKVSGSEDLSFNSPNGLFEAGSTVTATSKLSSDESLSGWRCSVDRLDISTDCNTATFRMPNRSISLSSKKGSSVKIKITGGKVSSKKANAGDIITIMADRKDGKEFSRWNISGAEAVKDTNSSVTKIKVGKKDITIKAEYKDVPVSSSSSETSTTYTYETSYPNESQQTSSSSTHEADAKHAVYEVLDAGGYSVKVEHHSQGPLCDAAFKYAQSHDYLVTDYFNITVNDSLSTYEIPNTVRIKLTIPSDLQQSGRKWRMLCISEGGTPYSFDDEDSDDSTITFTINRFYAYAMCYSDYVEPVVEYPEPEPVANSYEEPSSDYYDNYTAVDTSIIKPSYESRIIGDESEFVSSDYSNTYTIYDNDTDYTPVYTDYDDYENTSDAGSYKPSGYTDAYSDTTYDVPVNEETDKATPVQSDKKPAINNGGNKTPTIFSL